MIETKNYIYYIYGKNTKKNIQHAWKKNYKKKL